MFNPSVRLGEWIKMYCMNKELIIRSGSDAVDFALLKDGKLIELHKEEEKQSNFVTEFDCVF